MFRDVGMSGLVLRLFCIYHWNGFETQFHVATLVLPGGSPQAPQLQQQLTDSIGPVSPPCHWIYVIFLHKRPLLESWQHLK